ncbi:hypothetical protein IG631_15273 [Alternaria alternata]|nr:hypothetical protein IG631_15273 [Alternaria alternata]
MPKIRARIIGGGGPIGLSCAGVQLTRRRRYDDTRLPLTAKKQMMVVSSVCEA